jgi:hypothetical protein
MLWTLRNFLSAISALPYTRVSFRTISLIGCGASGAYAPGPEEEVEEESVKMAVMYIA